MQQVYINRIVAELPGEPVDNDNMEKVLGMINDKPSRARRIVLKNNGIKSRHYILNPETGEPTMNNAVFTANAVRKLFDSERSMEDLTVLACGTTTPDQTMPSHTSMVHGELKSPPCEIAGLSGICCSGVFSLKYVYLAVLSGEHKMGVATGSETVSLMMRAENYEPEIDTRIHEMEKQPEIAFEKDFLRWMLSDGCGAMLLEDKPNEKGISLKIEWIDVLSFANELDVCMYAGGMKDENGKFIGWKEMTPDERNKHSIFSIRQDVRLLNANVMEYTVAEGLKRIAAKRGLTPDQVDYFLPHYSSHYFRPIVQRCLESIGFPIPEEKWFTNLTHKGNTGSASIYIIIEELFNGGTLKKGDRLLCYIPESGRFATAFMYLTVV